MQLRWLLFTACLVLANNAMAECECLWEGGFADVHGNTDLIVSGQVTAAKGNSIDFTLARTLRGTSAHSPIRIWLKTADYCRPEPALFPLGSTWVLALNRIETDIPGGFNPNTPNVSYGRIGDYALSSCGGYWLSENEGRVSGNLIGAPRWVREPTMTPVLLDLVADYVAGAIPAQMLLEATQEDPALRELMLDTRVFLRSGQ